MRPTTRSNAPLQRGVGEAAQQVNSTDKGTHDPRELQGIAPGRNANQRAPVWPTPPGHRAALDLGVALRGWTANLGREPNLGRGRR